MEVTMLLCDFAEAIQGKLYIAGGGWTKLKAGFPLDCAVAISVAVPWNQTNQRHQMTVELLTEDGAENDPPAKIDGEFEVGRPPGSTPGEPIGNTMAFRFRGVELPAGGYRFSFKIDGTEVAATPFRVEGR
jgi:hypothetical protein